jgi:sugar/nucleoside kinase (ribokinase family)
MHDQSTLSGSWDVLGLGAVAVDDLIYLDEYPAPDSKVRVQETRREGGGLCGTALVAAARLGARAAYAGALGSDELSTFTVQQLQNEGIDCSAVILQPNARPRHSTILVEQAHGTRTILASDEGWTELPPEYITPQLITRAKVLFIDHCVPHSGIAAAKVAREHNIPVVADIERLNVPRIEELLNSVDHLIVGVKCARELTNEDDVKSMVKVLSRTHEVAVVTHGEHGCWFSKRGEPVLHQPAFQINVVDTTGCGDVFHGAYAAGLARGDNVETCVRTAAACAALKATQHGGRRGIPNREQIKQFMQNDI